MSKVVLMMAERKLGPEARASHKRRLECGFYEKYLSGKRILDIGYRGETSDAVPIVEGAVGVELDYPGYDGLHLPFNDNSQDAVFASHCLEHITDYKNILRDWYRVLAIGGFLIIAVPHQYLYERRATLPSKFNGDHKRFYTPASLLAEIEQSIPVDGYRVRSLTDVDEGFNYSTPPHSHAEGRYEIELVIQKIARPEYGPRIGWKAVHEAHARRFYEVLKERAAARVQGRITDVEILDEMIKNDPLPSFSLINSLIGTDDSLMDDLRVLLATRPFDSARYFQLNPVLATELGDEARAHDHFIYHGYFEGRDF
jgi:SAM-dependent methyltransferase